MHQLHQLNGSYPTLPEIRKKTIFIIYQVKIILISNNDYPNI